MWGPFFGMLAILVIVMALVIAITYLDHRQYDKVFPKRGKEKSDASETDAV